MFQTQELGHKAIEEIELDRISPPLHKLRPMNYAVISELVRSIRNVGLLQPIVVRVRESGYEIVFGSHRFEACRNLCLKKVSAIVLNLNDAEAFLARAAENLLRNSEIDPIEEARGYKSLVQEGWTINAIGERIGKSDSYVCRRLGMLDGLDSEIIHNFSNKDYRHVSSSHMELISLIPEKARQKEFVNLIEGRRLSVRALENLLNNIPAPTNVLLEDSAGECAVKIPADFRRAAGFNPGDHVRLYVRGRKLILESRRPNRRKTTDLHKPH